MCLPFFARSLFLFFAVPLLPLLSLPPSHIHPPCRPSYRMTACLCEKLLVGRPCHHGPRFSSTFDSTASSTYIAPLSPSSSARLSIASLTYVGQVGKALHHEHTHTTPPRKIDVAKAKVRHTQQYARDREGGGWGGRGNEAGILASHGRHKSYAGLGGWGEWIVLYA